MSRPKRGERAAKPWGPSSPTEVVLDAVTLGLTRERRKRHVSARYAHLDLLREQVPELATEMTPRILPDLKPDPKTEKLARLALDVVCEAETVHIDAFQSFGGTLVRDTENKRRANLLYFSLLHEPTLYRIKEATGRDYRYQDEPILTVLVSRDGDSVSLEGMGPIANEYHDVHANTGRTSLATFLIRGLAPDLAVECIGSLREDPAETLDGITYTALADMRVFPGRSLLQNPTANEHSDSLFIPGAYEVVTKRWM